MNNVDLNIRSTHAPCNAEQAARRRHLAQLALRGYEHLTTAEKVELLSTIAEIVTDEEAQSALHTAFLLQELEAKQLKFFQLISPSA
ncbi:MAG TPA: hypothetical protein VL357_05865 [Rariglobus sp.]|jgi:hypothetical protein|nr:hypothetical protein [Rariglobus sp.]